MNAKIGLISMAVVSTLVLSGCASSLSPYGGNDNTSCATKYMEGIPCNSITGNEMNYKAGNLKWQQVEKTRVQADEQNQRQNVDAMQLPVDAKPSPRSQSVPTTGFPMRTPERVLRIWFAPYKDEDNALNDQKYVFVTVQKGDWNIEANRAVIRPTYKQIFPLGNNAPKSEDRSEVDVRATGKSQAQAAIFNNPNMSNFVEQPPAQGESQ